MLSSEETMAESARMPSNSRPEGGESERAVQSSRRHRHWSNNDSRRRRMKSCPRPPVTIGRRCPVRVALLPHFAAPARLCSICMAANDTPASQWMRFRWAPATSATPFCCCHRAIKTHIAIVRAVCGKIDARDFICRAGAYRQVKVAALQPHGRLTRTPARLLFSGEGP